jgi:hypothetical protein
MNVTLVIPPALYDKFQSKVGEHRTIHHSLVSLINRFQSFFDSDERVVVLSSEARKRLEHIFGGPIEDGDRFAEWLEKQLSVQIGGVMVPLSEGQRKRIAAWAEKGGLPPAQVLKDAALKIAVTALGGA